MENKTIYLGDCLDVLARLPSASANLIYLDPPFFTGRLHSNSTRDGNTTYAFRDAWASTEDYRQYLSDRITSCKRVLRSDGSIFVHCDHNSSHILRGILDLVFGEDNFRSEIIWSYKRWSNAKRGLLQQHQNILFYSRTQAFKWNPTYVDYSATTNVDQILQKRSRDARGKAVYATDAQGSVLYTNHKRGVPLGDVWEIPFLNPKAKERTGYPTQKPLLLLERIIELTTDPGDMVIDPFCGSGTTVVAAKLLNRAYIGIDISQDAVALCEARLKQPVRTDSALLKEGASAYRNDDPWVEAHLLGFSYARVHRNYGADAILKEPVDGRAAFVRVQRTGEPLTIAADALEKLLASKGDAMGLLIATEDDLFMHSFPRLKVLPSPALQLARLTREDGAPRENQSSSVDRPNRKSAADFERLKANG